MTEPIHDAASRGFGAAAATYERSRPDYPADAVAAIVDALDLRPGRTVLELGAGTGKMTRLITPTGARILALEPVAAMRAILASVAPDVELVGGAAEAIPLPNESVDGVVVAQAFHWFDPIRALSEIHRVLRPGGRLVLIWNMRDEAVPWVKAVGELLNVFENAEPQGWREGLEWCALFGPFERSLFRHVQTLTREGVVERFASVSHVAAADPETRARLLGDIAAVLHADPETAGRAAIVLPYETELLSAERRTISPGADGVVASVNANGGGVPKAPVAGARVGRLGLENDAHTEPEPMHGGPDQAVCLYAQEAIERVRVDDHAAFPGAYGENLTLLGIDWASLAPGDRLAISGGDDRGAILLELVKPVAPGQTVAHWFLDRQIARISAKVHPEDARWYARVLRDGEVAPGMKVRHQPAGASSAS